MKDYCERGTPKMQPYRQNLTRGNTRRKYTRAELLEMTEIKLRNICFEERLVKGVWHLMDRESLISIILKYRSAETSYLIKGNKEGGFERVAEAVKKYLFTKLADNGKIKIPAKISLYWELGLDRKDEYKVTTEIHLDETNVLLVSEKNELCGIFNLVRDENQNKLFYLVTVKNNLRVQRSNNRHYSLLFFKKDDSEYLYQTYYREKAMPPTNFFYYKIPINDLEIRELEETGNVLAIDFGTSNTTAGVYLTHNYVSEPCYNDILNERIKLNEINFVKFSDGSFRDGVKDGRMTEVLPTVVYVADCADPQNIRYCFGYEAKSLIKKNDYTGEASVFQGIKRWVNNYTLNEEITDERGNVAQVKRGDLIRAYLLHIIQTAEHQFKCRFQKVHISSPVKLKQQSLTMFREILAEYQVETQDALDEGLAVLYNTIADQIEKSKFNDGEEYQALVIDCGGGTTDLSSCRFSIREGFMSYKIDLHMTFENGDTNFGGNNITYRILQFMKIVLAHYYRNKREIIDIDSLIEIPNADIFRSVDELGAGQIYEQFQQSYEAAEAVIPTHFKEFENKAREDYQRVKNNYYFLWEIADNMKKEFFQKTNILRNRFDYSGSDEQDSDLHIIALTKWCLSILENGAFRFEYNFPGVVFNIKEINKLIKADIYDLVRKFLEKFYENRELQNYSIIKLTGQSCRIDAFREALKEFVPGKSIEFKQKKEGAENTPDLKLACLRGALRYINAKTVGEIEATIHNDIAVIPYTVSALTYNKEEKVLLYSQEKANQSKGFISRPIGIQEVAFSLKSHEGVLRREYICPNDFNEYKAITAEEIIADYPEKIVQEDTDTIRDGEARFFLFAQDDCWGFDVLPIARKDGQLLMAKKKYFAFEDDLSELDFFDGLK
jgi:hypothetical protein